MQSKIQKNKVFWLARQTVRGWTLTFCVGTEKPNEFPITSVLFTDEKEIKRVVKGNIIFVYREVITKRKIIINK
ncbi:MAG: hypothetical protein COY66_05805 [Candidatus Kerfeldbacteria bacterium CG_4_10_14_0_8_um_filter_42_10]|uniref:Uncharacterized protein n=1 Tax=Candidatus Kerfeldbacteria bacterium CG_4_10_14_0_8_um_filter_42_10 TaxID=2014248 RepID=A0A2M7RGE4_9BACT|nr:MAG: hypothetical protein COY66_05805 [Candidatus Kerfeldbacteria bacterium CG_4_10_14_0_8_um_filter_42_10]